MMEEIGERVEVNDQTTMEEFEGRVLVLDRQTGELRDMSEWIRERERRERGAQSDRSGRVEGGRGCEWDCDPGSCAGECS
jgi:hypothetical protein